MRTLHHPRCFATTVVLGAILLTSTADAGTRTTAFRDPSKKIRCATKESSVLCLIAGQKAATSAAKSKPKPAPRKPPSCGYTASGTVRKRGKATLNLGCFRDNPLRKRSFRTLGYGKKIKLNGVTCTVRRSGVRCVNADKHGFELRRTGTIVF